MASWSATFEGPRGGDGADEPFQLADVGRLARGARRRLVRTARAVDRVGFPQLLREHLEASVEDLAIVEERWPAYEHVNVAVALDAWLAERGRTHQLIGMGRARHMEFGLSDLLRSGEDFVPVPANVSWTNLPSGPNGQTVQATPAGIYLVTEEHVRTVVMVFAGDPHMGEGGLSVHLVADRPGAAQDAATALRRLAVEHNVFRGQVISFDRDMFGERDTALQFRERPHLPAEDVILPEETLATLRRQVVGVAEHRERLLASRQHLKRGLLLYGPPGVGKTHTVRHLISQLRDTTIVVLTGSSLGLVSTACSVARTLQPAMIVIEDVDLVAEDREMYGGGNPMLFELLNQMDGLAEDADVVFLLTTNRAGSLESALAARPGRVDQAVELTLPDLEMRRRLFDLYRGELVVDTGNLDTVLGRADGVTASFLKELLRRAALLAAEDSSAAEGSRDAGGPLAVSTDQLDAALEELLDTRNAMTRALLGGPPTAAREEHEARGGSGYDGDVWGADDD